MRGFPTFIAAFLLFACAASAQTTLPSYPETNEGLQQYFQDILDAGHKNAQPKLLALCDAMVLESPDKWFVDNFGAGKGEKLAEAYKTEMNEFGPKFAVLILRHRELNLSEFKVNVVRLETLDNPNAKANQLLAIDQLKNFTPLYNVTLLHEKSGTSIGLWSFVWINGKFKLAGKMNGLRG
jgi:hypothetical protein